MRRGRRIAIMAVVVVLMLASGSVTHADIYDFRGGVRIPAGSCATYAIAPRPEVISTSGGLAVHSVGDRIDLQCVCQVPVPEKAKIRQFVMVGNVTKGTITASLGGVRWNVPRQHSAYATVRLRPETPFEVPAQKQKKMVQNLPSSGNGSVVTDRVQTYFIEARLTASSAVSIEEALEIFYFEIYWD